MFNQTATWTSSSPLAWPDRLVEAGVLFLLVFTPLAHGTVEPWAEAIAGARTWLGAAAPPPAREDPLRAPATPGAGGTRLSDLEVGNLQLRDREQLACAAREGRCLVTRNAFHFIPLAQEAIRRQEPHAGIILCPPSFRGSEIAGMVAALSRVVKRS